MKKVKIIVPVMAVILIAVLTLPFPTGKTISFDGADITDSEQTEISMEGKVTYLNYLIKDDRLKGRITISPYEPDRSESAQFDFYDKGSVISSLPRESGTINFCSMVRYNEIQNTMTPVTLFFDRELDRILIEDGTDGTTRTYISHSEKYKLGDNIKFFETR